MSMKAAASLFGGMLFGATVFGGGAYVCTSNWAEQKISQMEPHDAFNAESNSTVTFGYGKARHDVFTNKICFESDDVKFIAGEFTAVTGLLGGIAGMMAGVHIADKKGWNRD